MNDPVKLLCELANKSDVPQPFGAQVAEWYKSENPSITDMIYVIAHLLSQRAAP